MLRKHQADLSLTVHNIMAGKSPVENIICDVTPGGGKSMLPIIAGQLIPHGLADAICWVSPRTALQDQGERNFLDPRFRKMLNHRLTIRSSTNEINPCRGLNGFITTYQAIGVDAMKMVAGDFRRKRYILVLDEFHHVESGSLWHDAITPLYDLATFRLLMTGTMERGDRKSIAFLKYRNGRHYSNNEHTRVIRYTRTDALEEKAIIPLEFTLADGNAEWESANGEKRQSSLSNALKEDVAAAIYTAVSTEFAFSLLSQAIKHWRTHKQRVKHAKMLVVAADKPNADRYMEFLYRSGVTKARIATSHDSPQAIKNIKAYKGRDCDCLVTIAMAYEGLDVPEISHLACLTNIRSKPWVEQMLARAVRIDPKAGPYENQCGYVYAPNDTLMQDVVARIRSEQVKTLKYGFINNGEQVSLFGDPEPTGDIGKAMGIAPLRSSMTGQEMMSLGNVPVAPVILTPSETEDNLRDTIERHVRKYAFNNNYDVKRINTELLLWANKPRANMTIPELENTLSYVRSNYPLNGMAPQIATPSPPRNPAMEWESYFVVSK